MHSEFAQSTFDQKQLYDDLSALILTFKRLASLAETVAISIQKGQDHTAALLKMKQLLETLDPMKQKYESASTQSSMQPTYFLNYHRAFYRFICRLLQVIAFLKGKSQNRGNQPHFSILDGCFRQIELSIKRCKDSKELFRLIKIIQMSFVKFCLNCQPLNDVLSQDDAHKCEQSFKQMRQRIVKEKVNQYNCDKSNKFGQLMTEMEASSSDESDCKSEKGFKKDNKAKPNYHIRTEFSKYDQVYTEIYLSYREDLDYSSFKSDYFLAKANQPQFYRQYLEKNISNRRIIAHYYDDFYLFQKKKTQKQIKKDKFKLQSYISNLQVANNSLGLLVGQNCLSDQQPHQEQEQNVVSMNMVKVSCKLHQSPEEPGFKSLDYESGNKKQLKMKNVQITLLNMNRQGKKYKISSNHNKHKSRLQPICINQSYYNELQSQTKNSLQFLHRKLKVELVQKKGNNAEYQKKASGESGLKEIHSLSEITKQGTLLNLVLKSKSSFKGKYLQVNCRHEKKEDQIRRLLSKDGSVLQKITLQNLKNLGKRESQGRLTITNQQQ